MHRILPFCVVVAVAGNAVAAGVKQKRSFPQRVLTLTDVVLQRHIDPPTRQQMLLDGARAAYRAVGKPVPQGLSRRISALSTPQQIAAFLKELRAGYQGKPATFETAFTGGLLRAIPGGVRLIDAEERKVQGQLVANRYVGTGIVLAINGDHKRPAIRKPFFNGPAWKAGAKANDVILKIDGKSTAKMPLREVVRLLRGKKGSLVELVVRQPKAKETRKLKITRNVAFIPTVEGHRETAPGTWQFQVDSAKQLAYLRINRIGSSTLHELRQAETQLRGQKIRGVVLDLRFGGGTLHDIEIVADALLGKGTIGRVRSGDSIKTHKCSGGKRRPLFAGLPMAVLVDRHSSSGREYLAAALQDNRKAIVVGEPTPGDGFVRTAVPIPGDDRAIVFAVGELQRADGTPLRATVRATRGPVPFRAKSDRTRKHVAGGVVPDHIVRIPEGRRRELITAHSYTHPELTTPARDPVLAKAVDVLNAESFRADSKEQKQTRKKTSG